MNKRTITERSGQNSIDNLDMAINHRNFVQNRINTGQRSENVAPFQIKARTLGRVNSQMGDRTKYQRLMQKNLKNRDDLRSSSMSKAGPHLRLPPANVTKKAHGKNFIKIH